MGSSRIGVASREHPRQFSEPLVAGDDRNVGFCPRFVLFFDDDGLCRRVGGHLRQMSDNDHLMFFSELGQAPADRLGRSAAHSGVDLVKKEGAVRLRRPLREGHLDGEHDSRKLAARGRRADGPERSPGMRGQEEFDDVCAMGRGLSLGHGDFKPGVGQRELGQLVADEGAKPAGRLRAGLAKSRPGGLHAFAGALALLFKTFPRALGVLEVGQGRAGLLGGLDCLVVFHAEFSPQSGKLLAPRIYFGEPGRIGLGVRRGRGEGGRDVAELVASRTKPRKKVDDVACLLEGAHGCVDPLQGGRLDRVRS